MAKRQPSLKSPRIRSLGTVAGFPTYLVSGEKVRNTIDLDFTQGGNGAVYARYIPPNEIWVDDAMGVFDRMATTLHEIVERDLMLFSFWPYEKAHDKALAVEQVFRNQLMRSPPVRFDGKRVADAYYAYKREMPAGRRAEHLEGEIDEILARRRRRA